MKRVGLYFGSFNPIHVGHLIIANFFATRRNLDEVWLVVSPHNPFKPSSELAPAELRKEMVKLAIKDNPALRISDIEFFLPQPSYTIDTLHRLKEEFPLNQWVVLMGEDSLSALPAWKNGGEIIRDYSIEVFPRMGTHRKLDPSVFEYSDVSMVQAPMIGVSSTMIRQLCSEEASIKYLVTAEVERFIQSHELYR